MSDYSHKAWPSWRYGPNGEAEIFESEAAVPAGWLKHPDEHTSAPKAAAPVKPSVASVSAATDAEVDADGWPYDPALHAATKSKTSAGLWRMKVGVTRPAPKVLDL